MMRQEWQPLLMVVSAPSGAGKTTLCNRLIAEFESVMYSVSCTTRAPREGEVDGKSYYFLAEPAFRERQEAGAFLEHALVHGHWYGTLRQTVLEGLAAGKDVLMDIDVQGAEQVRDVVRSAGDNDPLKRAFVDVFIAPPSMMDLQMRLFERGQDETADIERRLEQAEQEMARWREYSYMIVNDRLQVSYDALRAVFLAEHYRIR
jgi:guanylate kinase